MSHELSSLINEYNTESGIENNSIIRKYDLSYLIQYTIQEQNNFKLNTKKYKEQLGIAILNLNVKRSVFNKDAKIGKYLLEQNNPELYTKSKRELLAIVYPKKPREPKQSTDIKVDNNEELTTLQNKLHELSTEYRILQEWLDRVYEAKGGFDALCEKLQINRL